MRNKNGSDIMKHIYHTPNAELEFMPKDIITSSANDPYRYDVAWDLSKYAGSDPADLINNMH